MTSPRATPDARLACKQPPWCQCRASCLRPWIKRRELAGLFRRKLAAAEREVAMAGGNAIEVVHIRLRRQGDRK